MQMGLELVEFYFCRMQTSGHFQTKLKRPFFNNNQGASFVIR
jgi:hypothetical protein